jgi:fimbrial chaperone protein
MDIDGNESNVENEDDFLIYPPQLILSPNSQKTVRISWIGEPDLKKEHAFRLVAEQLPVKLESEQEINDSDNPLLALKLLFRYEAAFYVTPPSAKPNVTIFNITEIVEAGSRFAAITFANEGTKHRYLLDINLTIEALKEGEVLRSVTLTPDDIQKLGTWNILANSQRRYKIPLPKDFPKKHDLTAYFKNI